MCSLHDALAIAAEHDVAAVAGHRRAHPRVQQLLDLGDDLLVLGRDSSTRSSLGVALDHRPPGDEMLHDRCQHLRLQRLPGDVVGLGDGDEVAAEEHARDAGQSEQRARRAGCARPRSGRRNPPSPAPIT